jgi:phage/plasmid-associated DNA primase
MGRASEELYNTINCSFVFSEEFSEGDVLYDDQMKAAVGGVTEMEARPMYKPLRRFTPKASMVVATNHRPKVVGTDDGIWRRVRDLECIMYYTDDPDPRNPHQAKSRSAEQMAALLDDIYTVAASVSFARLKARAAAQVAKGEMGFGKLEPCPAVVRATAAYRMEQDLVAAFLDDKTKSVACATVVPQAEVVSVFQNWCATELGDPGAAKRKHNEMMQRMGKRYSKSAPNVKPKGWFNLRILYDDGEEQQQQHQNGEEASAATSNRRQRASAFGDEEDEEDVEPARRRARLEKVLDDLPEEEEEEDM